MENKLLPRPFRHDGLTHIERVERAFDIKRKLLQKARSKWATGDIAFVLGFQFPLSDGKRRSLLELAIAIELQEILNQERPRGRPRKSSTSPKSKRRSGRPRNDSMSAQEIERLLNLPGMQRGARWRGRLLSDRVKAEELARREAKAKGLGAHRIHGLAIAWENWLKNLRRRSRKGRIQ